MNDAERGEDLPDRYDRQRRLPGIGPEGQSALAASTILIVGCGALGSGAAEMLARAGIGRLRLVDRDIVEWSNLQRQVLYCERDAREHAPKALAAQRRLAEINKEIEIEPVVTDFRAANALRLLEGIDCIIDGLDNFRTRYLLNDLAVREGLPYVYGGAVATHGASMTLLPCSRHRRHPLPPRRVSWSEAHSTPCLRCLFPEPPPAGAMPTCETAGVLGPAVQMVAARQATDAIKLLTGHIEAIERRFETFDAWRNDRRSIAFSAPDPECPCCGLGRFDFLHGGQEDETITLCGRSAIQVLPAGNAPRKVDFERLSEQLSKAGSVRQHPALLSVELPAEGGEPSVRISIFQDGRAILHGVQTPERARSLYARYVGG